MQVTWLKSPRSSQCSSYVAQQTFTRGLTCPIVWISCETKCDTTLVCRTFDSLFDVQVLETVRFTDWVVIDRWAKVLLAKIKISMLYKGAWACSLRGLVYIHRRDTTSERPVWLCIFQNWCSDKRAGVVLNILNMKAVQRLRFEIRWI